MTYAPAFARPIEAFVIAYVQSDFIIIILIIQDVLGAYLLMAWRSRGIDKQTYGPFAKVELLLLLMVRAAHCWGLRRAERNGRTVSTFSLFPRHGNFVLEIVENCEDDLLLDARKAHLAIAAKVGGPTTHASIQITFI